MSAGVWERLWERLEENEAHWGEQDEDRKEEELWQITEREINEMAVTYFHEERDPLEEMR